MYWIFSPKKGIWQQGNQSSQARASTRASLSISWGSLGVPNRTKVCLRVCLSFSLVLSIGLCLSLKEITPPFKPTSLKYTTCESAEGMGIHENVVHGSAGRNRSLESILLLVPMQWMMRIVYWLLQVIGQTQSIVFFIDGTGRYPKMSFRWGSIFESPFGDCAMSL